MDATEKLITDYAERYAGHPMDKYHDARLYAEAYKHFEAGYKQALKDKEEEIERLLGLLVSLSNGEAMNVVRESEGVYSVIFKTPKAIP